MILFSLVARNVKGALRHVERRKIARLATLLTAVSGKAKTVTQWKVEAKKYIGRKKVKVLKLMLKLI